MSGICLLSRHPTLGTFCLYFPSRKGKGCRQWPCVCQLSQDYEETPETTDAEGEEIYFHQQFQEF